MIEEQKKKLEQKLWNIANTLCGEVNAYEFRDYIFGFIFHNYPTDRLYIFANFIWTADGIDFADVAETTEDGQAFLEALSEAAIDRLCYFLKPLEMFSTVAKRDSCLPLMRLSPSRRLLLLWRVGCAGKNKELAERFAWQCWSCKRRTRLNLCSERSSVESAYGCQSGVWTPMQQPLIADTCNRR